MIAQESRQLMQKLLHRFSPWALNWKRILIESGLFLSAYSAWLLLRSPESVGGAMIGSLAILAPLAAAALLTFLARPLLPRPVRWSWLFWGGAFISWMGGNFVRMYAQLLNASVAAFSPADLLNLLALVFASLALMTYPSCSRMMPSRFRFMLDAVISFSVVAVLGWLVIARPAAQSGAADWVSLLPLLYPVADLALLMILSTCRWSPRSRGGLRSCSEQACYAFSFRTMCIVIKS